METVYPWRTALLWEWEEKAEEWSSLQVLIWRLAGPWVAPSESHRTAEETYWGWGFEERRQRDECRHHSWRVQLPPSYWLPHYQPPSLPSDEYGMSVDLAESLSRIACT